MWGRLFFVWVALWRMAWRFFRVSRYVKKQLFRDLNLPPSVALSAKELSRIRHYLFGATYLSAIFDTMRGCRLNRAERQRLSSLAALASYFDDLVEISNVPSTTLGSFGAAADKRGIAQHLLAQVRAMLPSTNRLVFEQCLQQVFLIETAFEKPVDVPALQVVAAKKGGSSVLLFRCLFEPLPSGKEQEALAVFGHLIQLSDDILDVWFDVQDGIQTTATRLIREGQTPALSPMYKRLVQDTTEHFQRLPMSKYKINTTLAMIHSLAAVVHTGLFRYTQLEKRFGRLLINDRKHMVLDMGKWRNRLIAAGFLLSGNIYNRIPGQSADPIHA